MLFPYMCRLCLGAWADHGERTGGFYACNRYEAAKQEGAVWNLILSLKFQIIVSCVLKHLCYLSRLPMFYFYSKILSGSRSMMKQRDEEKWQRILWRDTLIIMNVGQAIKRYSESFPISVFVFSLRYWGFRYLP